MLGVSPKVKCISAVGLFLWIFCIAWKIFCIAWKIFSEEGKVGMSRSWNSISLLKIIPPFITKTARLSPKSVRNFAFPLTYLCIPRHPHPLTGQIDFLTDLSFRVALPFCLRITTFWSLTCILFPHFLTFALNSKAHKSRDDNWNTFR